MKRLGSVAAAVVVAVGGLAACGGNSGYGSGGKAPAATQPGGVAKLATADVGDLGKVVVDGNGRTVYVFDKDVQGKSNCDGDCAVKWPPVAAGTGTPQLDGVDKSLVGTTTRKDGSKQLTLGGLPLYLFAQDSKAGD